MVQFTLVSALLLVAGLACANPTASRNELVLRQTIATQEVSQSFNSLTSEIQNVRTSLAGGQISTEVARSRMQRIASEMQSSLTLYNGCSMCMSGGANTLVPAVSSAFREFNSLVDESRSTFGSNFSNVIGSTFNGVSSSMARFISSFKSSGVSVNQIIPPGFVNNLYQINMGNAASTISRYQSGY